MQIQVQNTRYSAKKKKKKKKKKKDVITKKYVH